MKISPCVQRANAISVCPLPHCTLAQQVSRCTPFRMLLACDRDDPCGMHLLCTLLRSPAQIHDFECFCAAAATTLCPLIRCFAARRMYTECFATRSSLPTPLAGACDYGICSYVDQFILTATQLINRTIDQRISTMPVRRGLFSPSRYVEGGGGFLFFTASRFPRSVPALSPQVRADRPTRSTTKGSLSPYNPRTPTDTHIPARKKHKGSRSIHSYKRTAPRLAGTHPCAEIQQTKKTPPQHGRGGGYYRTLPRGVPPCVQRTKRETKRP